MEKIKASKNNVIEMYPNEILKFFKYSLKYKLALNKIVCLDVILKEKEQLNNIYYIRNDDLDKVDMNFKKTK